MVKTKKKAFWNGKQGSVVKLSTVKRRKVNVSGTFWRIGLLMILFSAFLIRVMILGKLCTCILIMLGAAVGFALSLRGESDSLNVTLSDRG